MIPDNLLDFFNLFLGEEAETNVVVTSEIGLTNSSFEVPEIGATEVVDIGHVLKRARIFIDEYIIDSDDDKAAN